jgi:hypothetical protein
VELAASIEELTRDCRLWSFFFGRVDTDQDGVFSAEDRATLLRLLTPPGASLSDGVLHIPAPQRETLENIHTTYTHTGLTPPKATEIEFTALDGYAYFEAAATYKRPVPWPSFRRTADSERSIVCTIPVAQCFGVGWDSQEGFSSVEDVFKRVAFEKPLCGDCIIVALLNFAPRGLDAFLPPPSSTLPRNPPAPEVVGMATSFGAASFFLPPTRWQRQRCIALIQRYMYTIGNSPSAFYAIRSAGGFQLEANRMDRDGKPAFLALNDDMRGSVPGKIQQLDKSFRTWMEYQVPEKSRWEL